MATKIKDAPILSEIRETYWPGDSEVDLEASDLELWSRDGGRAGLVIAGDEKKVGVIRWRPLSPRALGAVEAAGRSGAGLGIFDLAFAFAFVSARNFHGVQIHMDSSSGIPRLSDESIRSFEQIQAALPIAAAYDEYSRRKLGHEAYLTFVAGQLGDEATADVIAEYAKSLNHPLDGITITRAVGVHVMAATFPGSGSA